MKEAIFKVARMYGDHHVLTVRETLLDVAGADEVQASAARRTVRVRFDEKQTSEEALAEVLSERGYGPDQAPVEPTFPERHKDGSPWYAVIQRSTTTERKDREMAGDFRRY